MNAAICTSFAKSIGEDIERHFGYIPHQLERKIARMLSALQWKSPTDIHKDAELNVGSKQSHQPVEFDVSVASAQAAGDERVGFGLDSSRIDHAAVDRQQNSLPGSRRSSATETSHGDTATPDSYTQVRKQLLVLNEEILRAVSALDHEKQQIGTSI